MRSINQYFFRNVSLRNCYFRNLLINLCCHSGIKEELKNVIYLYYLQLKIVRQNVRILVNWLRFVINIDLKLSFKLIIVNCHFEHPSGSKSKPNSSLLIVQDLIMIYYSIVSIQPHFPKSFFPA